jgi:formylglycine-generating enzyme required for sulfatase activity
MTLERNIWRLAVALAIGAGSLACPAEEKSSEGNAYPLWDGKESVAEYAKRAGLEPEMTLDLGDGVKMEFVLIPAGKSVMGSPNDEEGRYDNEGPQHEVTIGKPFYLGKFEVMQAAYEKVMKKNPSHFKGAQNPVENVAWDQAREFCTRAGKKTGRSVRLPSEAEWEYACRAGSKTSFHPPKEREMPPLPTDEQRRRVAELISKLSSDDFAERNKATQDLIALGKGIQPLLEAVKTDEIEVYARLASVKATFKPQVGPEGVGWFFENSDRKTHSVGEKEPNQFGLHDMLGNVLEWVEDNWHNDYVGAPADGSAWINNPRSSDRMFRGGSWLHYGGDCRSAYRGSTLSKARLRDLGFRVVLFAQGSR